MPQKYILSAFLLAFCTTFSLFSQSTTQLNVRFQGNDTSVKMMWTPGSWNPEHIGYNVKRRTNDGDWVRLNEETIISATDDPVRLEYITNSDIYLEYLNQMYDSLIQNSKIRSLSEEDFRELFLLDTSNISFLKYMVSIRYDFALIHGLGYYDTDIPKANQYTYGLFLVNENGEEIPEPVEKFTWDYGDVPDYSFENDYEIKKIRKNKGVQVTWMISTIRARENSIKGFHIYQVDSIGNRTRLTKSPVRLNMQEEKASLTHVDRELDNNKDWSFEAVPVDIFDTEGKPLIADYKSAEFPEINNIELSVNDSFEDAEVELSWDIDHALDPITEKYVIYRGRKASEPKEVLGEVGGEVRSFVDKVPSSGYYFYQVEIITTHGIRRLTNQQMVYKKLVNRPEAPQGLRASFRSQQGMDYVFIRWNPRKASDTTIAGYHLYTDGIMSDGLAREGDAGVIEGANYKYEIKAKYGKAYRFAISAVSPDGYESTLSDTLSIFVPSKSLPRVNIWPIDRQENVITLNWKYVSNIEDLAGFRLFQNGVMIASEKNLGPEARQWISPELEGGKYSYMIQAISRFDVKSEFSQKRNFNVPGEEN